MEQEKRKRRDDGKADGKRRKADDKFEGGMETTVTVTEDEVEEFFAILRRIQVAANYFKNRDGGGSRKLTAEAWKGLVKRDQPSDDLDGDDVGVKDETKSTEDSAQSITGLDLNLEPSSKEL